MTSRKLKKEKLLAGDIGGKEAISVSTYATEAFSDSEAGYNHRGPYYQYASSLPPSLNNSNLYSALGPHDTGNYTDDDQDPRIHDFGDSQGIGNKLVKSGRQRKKLAARTKGGEFQTKRRKRRIYFCCISSEIDVQKLSDYLHGADDLLYDWKFELHSDVLHMYKAGTEETGASAAVTPALGIKSVTPNFLNQTGIASNHRGTSDGIAELSLETFLKNKRERSTKEREAAKDLDADQDGSPIFRQDSNMAGEGDTQKPRLLGVGAREVFVFDFGAVVFWGFPRGEEAGLLKTIRMFVTKGMVGSVEFQSGEDDMAFVTSPDEKMITIANDVVTVPDDTEPKQRLAVSFAIAQSSVLAIFEARIEQKVDEYKYIPETLAAVGKVHLSERQLGMMIGEVFVIRHDVNLHTEILGKLCTKLNFQKPLYDYIFCSS
jgi:uncharacterized Rmd1/YagE family protein